MTSSRGKSTKNKVVSKKAYEVESFSKQNLEKFLNYNESVNLDYLNKRVKSISEKKHFEHIFNYLYKSSAKTIIVEKQYFSESYFGDYTNYYSQCFIGYSQWCIRLHFLSAEIDINDFHEIIQDAEDLTIESSYLGYIVIKPIPKGYLGATLFNPIDPKSIWAKRNYFVNLFGKEMEINTMPFQEQDTNIGACATTALWFALQITNNIFMSPAPSLSAITLSSGFDNNHTGKFFPSSGLKVSQICHAISSSGLTSELVELIEKKFQDNNFIKGFAYSYLRMGLPILMGIEFIANSTRGEFTIGNHLVTINGFSKRKKITQTKKDKDQITFESNEIYSFIFHDDQVGPFNEISFSGRENYLNTYSYEDIKGIKIAAIKITSLIVPIDPSIRIPYSFILEEVLKIDYPFRIGPIDLTWDIYLTKSNNYKKEVALELGKNKGNDYSKLLCSCLPKYIWVAKAYSEDKLIFDFIYDPSDINVNGSPFCYNIYNNTFKKNLNSKEFKDEYKTISDLFSEESHQVEVSRQDVILNKMKAEEDIELKDWQGIQSSDLINKK